MAGVKRGNSKAFQELNARLDELAGAESKVGWFESAKYENGRPVAAVAAGNELGIPSRSIPARPFMRPTAIEEEANWRKIAEQCAKQTLEGKMTALDAMDILATQAEGDIAKKIASITSPPLSPITLGARKYRQQGKEVTGKTIGEIARKLKDGTLNTAGVSDKPLVDTSHMVDTLTHTVEATK